MKVGMRKREVGVRERGFTLIELLVVVAIIVLLVAIMLPSLNRARQRANTTRCLANLKGIGTGLVVYDTANNGFIIPSYNMTGFGASGSLTIDGWPAILDRDGLVPGVQSLTGNIFYCPNTANVLGTSGSPINPLGYQDWPTTLLAGTDTGGQADPVLPIDGFGDSNGDYQHEIRCGYWINANNPIGKENAFSPNPYYTQSVGYAYSDGPPAAATRSLNINRPSALVTIADGVYAGQQKNTHLGDTSSRIGYRHLGSLTSNSVANAGFADGHAESLESNSFPRSTDTAGGSYTSGGVYSVLIAQ